MIHSRVDRQRPIPTPPTALVSWELPPSRSAARSLETHPGGPEVGAIVAVAICLTIAAVGWLLAPPAGWIVGAMGLPAATILGWWMAPSVIDATRRGAWALAGELAIGSILVTDALVAAVIMFGVVVGSAGAMSVAGVGVSLLDLVAVTGSGAAMWMLIVVIGAILVATPLLIVVLPAAVIWTFCVRWLAGHGWAA
jgi:hypothetical protein